MVGAGRGSRRARYEAKPSYGLGNDQEGCRIADRGIDLGSIPDDRGIRKEPGPVGAVISGNEDRIEAVKGAPEGLALGQDRDPGQAGLEALEGEALKQLTVAGNWNSPLFIVVGEHQPVGGGAVGSGDAARPPTARPDVCDHRRIRGWTILTMPAMSCRAIARPRSQHWLASICTGHSAPSAIESSTSGERADWPGKVEGSVTTSATGMFPNIGRSSSMPNGCSMASNKRTHA